MFTPKPTPLSDVPRFTPPTLLGSGKKSAPIELGDEDPITPIREKLAKMLRPKGRLPNLENLTAAIQELLESINKLMKDCQSAIEHDGQKLMTSTLVTRRDFDTVQTQCAVDESGKGFVMFKAYPKYEEKEFDITPLIKLPPELAILYVETLKSGFIKYDSLFQISYALHDSVMLSYLANLKNHLAVVESCLKDIHKWLSEPATTLSFIEHTFGVVSVKACEYVRKFDPFCSNCGYKYKMHSSQWSHWSPWQNGGSTQMKYCPDRLGTNQAYKRCNALEVKRFYTESKINESFTLSDKHQRARLLKLIEFVSYE